MGRLDGSCGVITGAAGGLGGEFARALVKEGAQVELWDLRMADALATELRDAGHARSVDIRAADQVTAGMSAARERFGRLDFLVNNAGVRTEVAFLDQQVDDWRGTLDVNLTGTFLCAQAAARIMVEDGGGRIVNISSISAIQAFTTRPAYIASKGGVMSLTRAIATELGGQGIVCNAIAPGIIETPLTRHYFENPEMAQQIRDGTPSRRWGQPGEIAAAVVFLCAPESEFVQGTTLVVDGGWTIGKGY